MANKINNSQQFLDNISYVNSERQFVSLGAANTAQKDNFKDIGVASALKLNNVFPINLSYKHGKGTNCMSGKLGPIYDKYAPGK